MENKRSGRNCKTIRHWLIQARYDSGLTIKEIVSKVGISSQCLYYYEVGVRTPIPKKAKAIASVLNFDWTKFYEERKGS